MTTVDAMLHIIIIVIVFFADYLTMTLEW